MLLDITVLVVHALTGVGEACVCVCARVCTRMCACASLMSLRYCEELESEWGTASLGPGCEVEFPCQI
jgi:hypothetical protein